MAKPPQYYKFLKSIENSQQFKILNDLFTNFNATVDNAILQTIDLTMAAHAALGQEKGFVPSNADYFISLSLMMIVQELVPTKHGRLVEFLCALQKQIATDPSTGEPLTVNIDKEVLWTNLPSLGYTEMETWRKFGGDYTGIFSFFFSSSFFRFCIYIHV